MRIVRIGDICEVIAGQSPLGSTYNTKGDGIEFHQGKKLFMGDSLSVSNIFTSSPTKLATNSDILISVRAPVGPTVYLDRDICIGRGLAAIRSKGGVDIRYLYLFLKHIEKSIEGTEGAVFPSINKSQIENLKLPLPEIEEQRRIVAKLDAAFKKIDQAIKLNAEAIEKVFKFKTSVLESEFNVGGKSVKLGEIFSIGSSRRVLKSQWRKTGVPFYRGREITKLSRNGFVDNELFIESSLYEEFLKKHGVPQYGDIMLTAIGTIGNAYAVQPEDKFYFKDASVLWMKRISNTLSSYVELWIKSKHFLLQLEDNGTTVNTLTIGKLQNITISLPSVQDQLLITEKLRSIFKKIDKLERFKYKKQEYLNDLKQSILSGVFSESAVK